MLNLLTVMLGGAIGSGMRYLVILGCSRLTQFPLGTITVNVTGCLLIGILGHVFANATGTRHTVSLGLIVGVLGGFTTFSSFGNDTYKLAINDQTIAAIVNVGISNILGLAAVVIGYRLAEKMWPI